MSIREEQVRAALREVTDPEVGLDVVALGLVYGVDVADDAVHVRMTMTSPACPMGEMLADQAEAAIRRCVPAAREVVVELVWEPAWRADMMSPEARAALGWDR
jgi:metal-sulfur cluster biosynthetic enzyme